jgi:hypothetical protein
MLAAVRRTTWWVLPVAAALLAGCGGGSSGGGSSSGGSSSGGSSGPPVRQSTSATGATTATGAACVLAPADPAATLPSGFPAPPGATFYRMARLGRTTVHFAYVAGSNVVAERDAIKRQLVAAGFRINGQDQEPNAEAELDADSAAHGGTLQVVHLSCAGYLRLRFTLDH